MVLHPHLWKSNKKRGIVFCIVTTVLRCIAHDGEYLYIPRRAETRSAWGAANGRKAETLARNLEIYRRYREGTPVARLAEEYFLTPKSVSKIIARLRNN